MHYTLFGHADFLHKEQIIQQRIATLNFDVADDMVVQSGENVNMYGREKYWVDLPGLHPIEVTADVVTESDLWEFVITDRKMLRQIRR